jgi:thymidylate synthase (FAD)
LVKHQVGLSWNEVSRRYVDDEPEFFLPDEWRKRADNVKQGSADETIVWLDREKRVATAVREANARALEVYEDMLNAGVAPEMARMVLPQNTMTEWIWSGSLYAFARVCNQRLDAHAQKETRDVAVALDARLRVLFPVSWRHLVQAGAAEVHPGDPGEPGSEVQVV